MRREGFEDPRGRVKCRQKGLRGRGFEGSSEMLKSYKDLNVESRDEKTSNIEH
jgi:hypothetical protein